MSQFFIKFVHRRSVDLTNIKTKSALAAQGGSTKQNLDNEVASISCSRNVNTLISQQDGAPSHWHN